MPTAIARNCDVDADGNLPTPLPPVPSPLPTLDECIKTAAKAMKTYDTKARETEIMLESTLEMPVEARSSPRSWPKPGRQATPGHHSDRHAAALLRRIRAGVCR